MKALYELTPKHIYQYSDLYTIEENFLYNLLRQCNGDITECINIIKKESTSVPKQHADIFLQRVQNCLEVIYNLHIDRVKTETKIFSYTVKQSMRSKIEILN